MKRLFSALIILGILCSMTACSKGEGSSSTTSEPVVGDFNFIQQSPVAPTTSSGVQVSIDREDGEVSGSLAVDPSVTDETGTAPEVISTYKDLENNVSLRLGMNTYVSLPLTQISTCCTLSDFLRASQAAYSLVPETQYNTLAVQRDVYKYGSCIHTEDNKMLIDGLGFTYWCINRSISLDEAKSPSMALFNLGTLYTSSGEAYSASYKSLGSLQEEDESEYYYRAVYTVADVETLDTVQAYAALIYDKQTSTLTTCMIATSAIYSESGGVFPSDVAIGSFRYSTSVPDNLIKVF